MSEIRLHDVHHVEHPAPDGAMIRGLRAALSRNRPRVTVPPQAPAPAAHRDAGPFLYVRNSAMEVTELRLRLPSGADVLIASG